MTSRTITRVTAANRRQIEADARAGLPYDTAIDVTSAGTLIVNGDTPFAGAYRIVKVKGPRWLGDNGYTFERDLNAADTITLNVPFEYDADYAAATGITDRVEQHFAKLVELITLNSAPKMTADEIAEAADGMFAASRTEAELNSCADAAVTGIDTFQKTHGAARAGALVSLINASYENALARIRRVNAPSSAGGIIIDGGEDEAALLEELTANQPVSGSIAHAAALVEDFGEAKAIDYIDHKMTPAALVKLAKSLQCPVDGATIVRAIRALIAEAETPAAPAEHKDRQRVIDRALEANRKYTEEEVDRYPLLREVAIDFVRTYRGENSFVQDVAIKLVDYGRLSSGQMRGALNIMVAEARFERATAKADALTYDRDHGDGSSSAIQDYYIDLRGRKERDLDDAGDAQAPADEAANEVAPAIPNGWYCVIIDPISRAQRTIRVGDCPDHFTVKPGTQLLSFLNGPDNTSDYTGFAFLSGRKVSIWRKFQTADALRHAADLLVADPMTSAAEYVKRSNRCFVCNRPLTVEKSIDAGIGPICAEKIDAMGFKLLLGTREAAVEENDNRDRLARTSNQPSPAEAALLRARARQAARGPITAEQAQTEIDELFPE
jgi:hypothetical protein